MDGAVEEAGGMRRVTAGRVSTYWAEDAGCQTAVPCDTSKMEAPFHQKHARANVWDA
jgi:hypothetical protein